MNYKNTFKKSKEKYYSWAGVNFYQYHLYINNKRIHEFYISKFDYSDYYQISTSIKIFKTLLEAKHEIIISFNQAVEHNEIYLP